jgi:type II secretory ATPase GspE/PulE/Tfp pilus assembly ATPase PilB-like protein
VISQSRQQLFEADAAAPAARALEHALEEAIVAGASDLHIEPEHDRLSLRLRVDGTLRALPAPPPSLAAALCARIRVLAGADLAQRRLPQDGRFSTTSRNGETVDIRAAFIPVARGEKITLRFLPRRRKTPELNELGLDAPALSVVKRTLEGSEGLIVVAGPTGSGKTTTLYALLESLRRDDRSVVSVEDPIEKELDGVAQVSVHEEVGRSFGCALRALLRQDPDVVLIGEMRDQESAAIACRAALTGHLVLTSLHATNTAEITTRLLDLGVADYMLRATLRLQLAQRLLRKPCAHCTADRRPSSQEQRLFSSFGITAPVNLVEGRGCPRCVGTGFAGREAVFEIAAAAREQPTNSQELLPQALRRAALGRTTIGEAIARCPRIDAPNFSDCS